MNRMSTVENDSSQSLIFQRIREAKVLTASRLIVIIIDNDNNKGENKKESLGYDTIGNS